MRLIQFLLVLVLAVGALQASSGDKKIDPRYADRDMDGVIDRDDRCPDTPFFALVNKNGCMIQKIKISKEQEESVKEFLSQSN